MKKDVSARLSHKKPYVNVDTNRDSRIDLLIVLIRCSRASTPNGLTLYTSTR